MQERRNSSALVMELRLSCINQSISYLYHSPNQSDLHVKASVFQINDPYLYGMVLHRPTDSNPLWNAWNWFPEWLSHRVLILIHFTSACTHSCELLLNKRRWASLWREPISEVGRQVGGDTWSTYVRPSGSRLSFYVRRTLIGWTEKI